MVLFLDLFFSNVDLCDLFFLEYDSELTNFVDDTTPHDYGKGQAVAINKSELTLETLLNFFQYNNFAANAYHMPLGKKKTYSRPLLLHN